MLNLALAIASLLQWLAGRLSDAEQTKLRGAVFTLAFMRKADEAIKDAKAARDDAAIRDADSDGLRASDGHKRGE